jgi:cobalt-zinc-cadmium efflux system membrane fusion protein
MTARPLGTFLRRLGRVLQSTEVSRLGDEQLLERFVGGRDEAAFEVLVCRHGPLVLGLCQRLLRDEQEAEDAFQATFLALACKAGSIARREALGSWLYKVAYRTALRGRARLRACGQPEEVAGPAPDPGGDELAALLDEEVSRLPAAYRAAVVLCYLQGQTHEAAARQLGCAPGTVARRLSWARQRLRERLARRGLDSAGVAAGGLGQLAPVVPSLTLVETTVAAARESAGGAVASALVEGAWRIMATNKMKLAVCVLLSAVLSGAGLMAWPAPQKPAGAGGQAAPPRVELVDNGTAVRLAQEEATRLGVRVGTARARPALSRRLELSGSLAFDPDRLARVQARFPGEVVEVGKLLRVGDQVKKGQVLAVVWSKDLGEKKSELIDALVKLRLDEEGDTELRNSFNLGMIPEANLRQSRLKVQDGRLVVARLRRTLQIWRVSADEIQAVEKEARRLADAKEKSPNVDRWCRVEVRAPFDGVIVEKNVAVGNIVDAGTELFKVADLTRLAVLVNVDEADVPTLRQLLSRHAPRPVPWQVRLTAAPEAAPLKSVGLERLDAARPNRLAVGHVDNAAGTLRAGQAVTATLHVPASASEVAVPASALVETGRASFVFVQPDPKKLVFVPRRVVVVRRGQDTAHVRASATPGQKQTLRPGERVVTAGALELHAALDDLRE